MEHPAPALILASEPRSAKLRDSDENLAMVKVLFDFSDAHAINGWTTIDDRVMGGVSQSRLRYEPSGHAVFEGKVSLERNGGFASVRSAPGRLGQSLSQDCVIEAHGDGQRFKLNLFTDDSFDTVSYQAEFAPSAKEWQVIRLPIQTFRATFRGREVPGSPALDPARIRQVGLMIAGRQAGAFALGIRSIRLD
jgi:NADH dehydrogenase [ubiquinone] 1 alpha subcomplex assembly factor 1